MFKNLKQFETLIGLMEIGHTAAAGKRSLWKNEPTIFFSGALIEYAVILFKKQKEQKEPKKEIHRSSGDLLILMYTYPCPDIRFIKRHRKLMWKNEDLNSCIMVSRE